MRLDPEYAEHLPWRIGDPEIKMLVFIACSHRLKKSHARIVELLYRIIFAQSSTSSETEYYCIYRYSIVEENSLAHGHVFPRLRLLSSVCC